MRNQNGFTLIELMVTVAIVAILASIALPSYQEYVRKGRRGDAMQAVGDMQMSLERWRAECPSYASGGGCPGTYPSATSTYYSVAISNQSGTAYTITASPKSGTAQFGDRCGNLVATATSKPAWNPGGAGCN